VKGERPLASIERVLIVGGGIAGQTLTVALARRGIACETVEIKPDFQIVGAGMYVQGNALRALREIGVVEEIVKQGWHPADDSFFTADIDGATLANPTMPRIAGPEVPPTVTIRRHVLHDILQDAVANTGTRVRMGTTVTAIEDDPAAAGVSKEPGNPRYDRADLPRLMREKFAGFGGAAPALLAQVQRPEQVVYTAVEEVTQPAPWYRGRVVLVGDAVHASSPFWAQGGSMAIEDVVVLAELIATGRPAQDILPEWQARRYERAVWVQRGSLETGERGHREGPGVYEGMIAFLKANMLKEVAARYAKFAEPI
jgi:2-polyprenyl-6-methoxyphenol hydroxylase-like FAD-dependent oxidoreductase